jgi:hypothetical protein
VWWLYVVAGAVLAFVIFQAWDRRRSAVRFSLQEKGRVDRQSALDAESDARAESSRSSSGY